MNTLTIKVQDVVKRSLVGTWLCPAPVIQLCTRYAWCSKKSHTLPKSGRSKGDLGQSLKVFVVRTTLSRLTTLTNTDSIWKKKGLGKMWMRQIRFCSIAIFVQTVWDTHYLRLRGKCGCWWELLWWGQLLWEPLWWGQRQIYENQRWGKPQF